MFRALIAERFPDHAVLGEEFGAGGTGDAIPQYCWVFDPVDGTTNYAHGLPIFCSSLALEIDGEPVVAAIYDPNRRELFTAERGQGAWLNGAPMRVSAAAHAHRFAPGHRFPYDVQKDPGEVIDLVRRASQPGPRGAPAGLGRDRPLLCRGRPLRRLLGTQAPAVGRRGRRADRCRGRRAGDRPGRGAVWLAGGQCPRLEWPDSRRRCWRRLPPSDRRRQGQIWFFLGSGKIESDPARCLQ